VTTFDRAAMRGLRALPGPGQPPLPAWPGRGVDIGGQRLFVRTCGTPDGEPTLFVHGLGGSATNWTDLMALLADRVDGHALDLPGFGHSGPPVHGSYALDAHVQVVHDYLVRTWDQPVHLLGNSLGGAVTTRLTAEHPELVRSLTLVSAALPAYRPRSGTDPTITLLLVPGLAQLAMRVLSRRTPEQRTRAVIELCFAAPNDIPAERIAEAVEEMRRRRALAWTNDALTGSLRGLAASYFDRGSRALWRQAAALRVPTLVIHGTHDRLVPTAVGVRAGRVIPGARLMVLDDVGHVPQMERPQVVAEAFLDLIDPAAAPAR
jgi:pimeloyl-ACP methyl ester carboxylesterase